MRKPVFVYAKTKAHIIYLVTVQLISTFVFAIYIAQSLFSDLVGNPEARFSRDKVHYEMVFYRSTQYVGTILVQLYCQDQMINILSPQTLSQKR